MKSFALVLVVMLLVGAVPVEAKEERISQSVSKDHLAQRELAWRLRAAHLVAFQPGTVGWDSFAESQHLSSYLSQDKKIFQLGKKIKSWPMVRLEQSSIVISSTGRPDITIQPGEKDGEALVNGRIFRSTGKPVTVEDVKKFFASRSAAKRGIPGISEAHAADIGDVAAGTGIGLGAYVLTTGVLNAITPFAVEAAVTTTVVGGAVGGVVYAGTVGVVGCGMASGFGYFHGDGFNQRWANCLATPLSWINQNFRDRLYLKDINCKERASGAIVAEVESPSGIKETRKFTFKDDELQQVSSTGSTVASTLNAQGGKFANGTTTSWRAKKEIHELKRPRNDKQLDQAQTLFRDFEYYNNLCKNPTLLAEAKKRMRDDGGDQRAYDSATPEALHDDGTSEAK